MHTSWQELKQGSSRFSILLFAANALLSVGFLVLRLVLSSPVGTDPLGDLGLVLMHGAFAIWVVFSGTLASLAGFIGVALGGRRKRRLALPLGHALLVFPHVVGMLWFYDIGGTFADRGVEIRRIDGTEHADDGNSASGPALSVSPDETWVTYWEQYTEWKGAAPTAKWRLSSVDLKNARRTVHSLDSLTTWADGSTVDWDDVAWGFDPGGWSGARLFTNSVDGCAVVDPAREPIVPCGALPGRRTGTDSPSWSVVAGELSRRGMRTENFELERQSLVWTADGARREVYYVQHLSNGVDAIICRDGEQTREVLRKQDGCRVFEINQVRISPDRTFLAYSAFATGKAYLPIPDHATTVFIRHLPSGEEKRAGRHMRVSNLIWSADSQRLYYAGSGFERVGLNKTITRRGAGVYCTNVAATFPVGSYVRVPPPPPDPTPDQMLESATTTWQRYTGPGASFVFRYPQQRMVLDDYGDVLVLRDKRRRPDDSCPNERQRPERFYAQIQMDHRDIGEIIEGLIPEFRDGRWRPIPGRGRSPMSNIRVGSVHGMRLTGPADCEYTYVLPTESGATLVITRATRPETEKENLAGSIPAFGESELPHVEDPTFAYILSSIVFNP